SGFDGEHPVREASAPTPTAPSTPPIAPRRVISGISRDTVSSWGSGRGGYAAMDAAVAGGRGGPGSVAVQGPGGVGDGAGHRRVDGERRGDLIDGEAVLDGEREGEDELAGAVGDDDPADHGAGGLPR